MIRIFFICALLVSHVVSASPYQMPNSHTKILKDIATKREYELYIKLPEGYSEDAKYPVVYTTDSAYTFPIIAGAVQVPMAAAIMEKVIVVGISKDLGAEGDVSRLRDYTPTLPKSWQKKAGEADVFHNFIVNSVFKYIDNTYSTDINDKTFVGVSLGGMLGAYFLLKHPDTFANYLLASPALWFDDGYIFKLEKEYAKSHKDLKAKVYLSVGSLEVVKGDDFTIDMVSDSAKLYTALKSRNYKNLKIKNTVVDSANHEISFPTSSIMGLYWLFGTGIKN